MAEGQKPLRMSQTSASLESATRSSRSVNRGRATTLRGGLGEKSLVSR